MLLPLSAVRVAVVNDYPVVVAGLVTLLKHYAPRVQVEGYVQALPPPDRVDVVLLDTFARPEGLARLRQVVHETRAPVLLYTWTESQEQIDAAIQAGASGFLSKTLDAEEILTALQEALAGRPPRPSLAFPEASTEPSMAGWPGQQEGLSARESEILCLIVAGLSNLEIAERNYLSINTVKTYIRTAYRKINVQNRTQAVLWGIDHGLRVEPEPADLETH
jgi:DNA-binding NarL/FixJ family response regulator